MSPPLKLQQRDDPLAVNREMTEMTDAAVAAGEAAGAPSGAEASAPALPPEVAARTRPSPRRTRTRGAATAAARREPKAETVSYDDDRLEQTGWRIYDSLLAEVRERAQQLTDAGIPTSAAALAAATLHSHLPRTVEEGTELMRVYRQASAGRRRARTAA